MTDPRWCAICGRTVRVRYEGSSTIARLPEGWVWDEEGLRCPEHRVHPLEMRRNDD